MIYFSRAYFFVLLVIGLNTAAAERFEYESAAMGVPVRIILYSEEKADADSAAAAAFDEFQRLNKIMSDYDSGSELSKLCETVQPTAVSSDLLTVLKEAKHYCTLTDGAFDITVGPMVQLWRRSRRQKKLPQQKHIDSARQRVGNNLWQIDEEKQTVTLLKEEMKLDLGGIAKGYAVDKAFEIIQKRGIKSVLVDAGGDFRTGDAPTDSQGWRIQLENGETVLMKNIASATSGDQFQFVEIDGVRYSHIVNPQTGLGLTKRCTAGVSAPTAMQADALATAACILYSTAGKEKIEELKKKVPETAIRIQQHQERDIHSKSGTCSKTKRPDKFYYTLSGRFTPYPALDLFFLVEHPLCLTFASRQFTGLENIALR